jgi:tetratricopeptide (TPR) repeat protein
LLWQAETAFEQACHHWAGRFLQYIELPDRAYFHQAHLNERYHLASTKLAELLIQSDEQERAMTVAEKAFHNDPGHKDTARILHDLYSQSGQRQKCGAILNQYKSALKGIGYSEEELADEIEDFFGT